MFGMTTTPKVEKNILEKFLENDKARFSKNPEYQRIDATNNQGSWFGRNVATPMAGLKNQISTELAGATLADVGSTVKKFAIAFVATAAVETLRYGTSRSPASIALAVATIFAIATWRR